MTSEDTLRIGPALPGAALRLLLPAVAVVAGLGVGLPDGWLVFVAAAGIVGAILPMTGATWVAAAVLLGAVVLDGPDPGRTALVVCAVHLLQVLGSLSLVVPFSAHVALSALRPTGARFALVQGAAQAAAWGTALLPSGGGAPIAVLAASAAVLAAVGAAAWLWQRRRLAAFPE